MRQEERLVRGDLISDAGKEGCIYLTGSLEL